MSTSFESLLEKANRCQLLEPCDLKRICIKATEIFMNENNIVQVQSPVSIVGDIHGQFHDLQELFVKSSYPNKQNKFIFLGDIVDRGYNSVECISQLFLLKILNPNEVTILRGNHETRITRDYGFYRESIEKFGTSDIYNMFQQVYE